MRMIEQEKAKEESKPVKPDKAKTGCSCTIV